MRVPPFGQVRHGLREGARGFRGAVSGAAIGAVPPRIDMMISDTRPDKNRTGTSSGAQIAGWRIGVPANGVVSWISARDASATLLNPPFLISTQTRPAISASKCSNFVGNTALIAASGVERQAMVMTVGATARKRGGGSVGASAASDEGAARTVQGSAAAASAVAPRVTGVHNIVGAQLPPIANAAIAPKGSAAPA